MRIWLEYQQHYRSYNLNIRTLLWHYCLWQMGAAIYGLLFPLYLLAGGLDEQAMGSLFALSTLGMALTAIPAGLIADRIGRKRSFVIGALASLIVAVLRASVLHLPLLRLLHFADGAFLMLFMASYSPFVAENTNAENRVHAFSLGAMGMLGAGIIGNYVGGLLPRLGASLMPNLGEVNLYRAIFLVALLLMAYSCVFLLKIKDSAREQGSTLAGKWTWPDASDLGFLWRYMVAAGLVALGAAHFMPFATPFFRRTFAATPGQLGLIFSLTQLTVLLATAIAPSLAAKWQPIPAILFTRIISLPLLFGISTVTSLPVAGGLFMLRSAFMQMSSPLETTFFVSHISPKFRATANGINNMVMSSLRALATYSAGFIITSAGVFSGYPATIQIMLFCYILSTFFWWFYFSPRRK
ncbi:MAG: hypothetical protein DDT34_01587 [Firmicutes bacterium]|nr:hypothetical protein [Bacillota bacterium]